MYSIFNNNKISTKKKIIITYNDSKNNIFKQEIKINKINDMQYNITLSKREWLFFKSIKKYLI